MVVLEASGAVTENRKAKLRVDAFDGVAGIDHEEETKRLEVIRLLAEFAIP